jgi:hypothetical protein
VKNPHVGCGCIPNICLISSAVKPTAAPPSAMAAALQLRSGVRGTGIPRSARMGFRGVTMAIRYPKN